MLMTAGLYSRVLQLIKLTDASKIDVLDLNEFEMLLQYIKSQDVERGERKKSKPLEGNAVIRDPDIHTKTLETLVSVQKIALADSDGKSSTDTANTDELRDEIQARSGNQEYISPAPSLLADDHIDDERISAAEQDVDSDEEAPELFIPTPEQLSLEMQLMREQQARLDEICAEFEKHMKHRSKSFKRALGNCMYSVQIYQLHIVITNAPLGYVFIQFKYISCI